MLAAILGNVTIMLLLVVVIIVIIVYVFLHFRPEKRVELLRPRDSRGTRLRVTQETDIGLTCKKSGGVVHRFIKVGRGWTFNIGGKMVTKFFGLEGTAYTGMIKGDEVINVSLSEFLKNLWGPTFYGQIPSEQRTAVETDVIGVTIRIAEIDEEEHNLPTLHADDIHDEGDNIMLRRFAKSGLEGQPKSYVNYAASALIGALTMYLAIGQGWF